MGKESTIGWTDATANFWMGCQKVSPGCEHCYAEHDTPVRTHRAKGLELWGPPKTTERYRTKGAWKDVPALDRAARRDGVRKRLFVSSLADIFEDHPMVTTWRAEALDLLASCTNLDVQLLTKRPQNIRAMVPPSWLASWPAHVWAGCTVENQRRADERIPALLEVPAPVRFLSCEPLLECVTLSDIIAPRETIKPLVGLRWVAREGGGSVNVSCGRISWVIVGGESGHAARPFHLAWARSIVAACHTSHVPVFVKQLGANPWRTQGEKPHDGPAPFSLRDRAGADPEEWPEDLRVQQFPEVPSV
jgi:protein gp37